MDRRLFLISGASASGVALANSIRPSALAAKATNVVLVHGLFADGSCWVDVIRGLQLAGLKATAVQNPLTTLDDAVAELQRVLRQQDGPTVLVAHSFAGVIITQAGIAENVGSLVYIAARAPDAGEDYTALAKQYPAPPASAGIVFDGDVGQLTEESFLTNFANGVPAERAKVLYAVQQPFHKQLVEAKTTQAAWRSKPSFYAVSSQDRTINSDLERFMAKRMKAYTIEIPAGHLSMISHPKQVTDLILRATAD